MKAVVYRLIVMLFVVLLLTLSTASAQEGEDDEAMDESSCILGTFCSIMLFIIFLIYFSAKHRSERSSEGGTRGGMHAPPPQQRYRYPVPHTTYPTRPITTYPQRPEPQKRDVKCDLCSSRNLRFFEKGYVKCNDCRHVFYISEGYSRKRGR